MDRSGTAAVNGDSRECRNTKGGRLQLRDYLGGDSGSWRPLRGSQDVYDGTRGRGSLSVSHLNLSPHKYLLLFILKIVSRVSASENPPLRPEVAPKDCPPDILSLMDRCWHEVPDERPSFHTIRGTIRGIMKYLHFDSQNSTLVNSHRHYMSTFQGILREFNGRSAATDGTIRQQFGGSCRGENRTVKPGEASKRRTAVPGASKVAKNTLVIIFCDSFRLILTEQKY